MLDNLKFKQKMGIFLTALLFLTFIFLSVKQIFVNRYGPVPVEEPARWAPLVSLSLSLALLGNLLAGGRVCGRMPLCIMSALAPLCLMTSSVVPDMWSRYMAAVSFGLQVLCGCIAVMERCGFAADALPEISSGIVMAEACMMSVVFLYGVYRRLSNIKAVMKSSSVWSMVCLSMDSVYMIAVLLIVLCIDILQSWMITTFLCLPAIALCIRIRNSSALVIFTGHERRIVESMRITSVEVATLSEDKLYDDIYERVVNHFETNRPYLDNELTINDIVGVVFTNKLYISKAISHHTGRNFCQFVNYYQISYAIEMFRNNPMLKVMEMSAMCGFNSTTSFTAAFRLYMGEKPGEWCRKERRRLEKMSK